MSHFEPRPPRLLPPLGCLAVALSLGLLCMMPFIFVQVLQTALERLHLSAPVAALVVVGILVGSMINIPVHRLTRDEPQPEIVMGVMYYGMLAPQFRRLRRETIIAVNVGGCVIPVVLALWQILNVARLGSGPLIGLGAVCGVNILVCYLAARPVSGIGIMMPAFISPLVAVGVTWLVCAVLPQVGGKSLAPIAFTAGVAGPVIGADLFHLKDLLRVPAGMMSIGGAGTFDGIVLSGVLAALLA